MNLKKGSFIVVFVLGAIYLMSSDKDSIQPPAASAHDNNDRGRQGRSSDEELENTSSLKAGVARTGAFADLDPKKFSRKVTDYPGHPSYAAASFAMDCNNHFESREQEMRDRKNPARDQGLHPLSESARFWWDMREEQCRGKEITDQKEIDSLMMEAAKAGDIGALGYIVSRDYYEMIAAPTADSEKSTSSSGNASSHALGEDATLLALKGDARTIEIMPSILASDYFGKKNLVDSAAWSLIANRSPTREFSPEVFDKTFEPYDQLSVADRELVPARAQALYDTCCKSSDRVNSSNAE